MGGMDPMMGGICSGDGWHGPHDGRHGRYDGWHGPHDGGMPAVCWWHGPHGGHAGGMMGGMDPMMGACPAVDGCMWTP